MQNKIAEIQKKFRILQDWNITNDKDGIYYGQSFMNPTLKLGNIYPYSPDGEEEPKDYVFHEMLHFCMSCINNTENYIEKREKEEMFVQYLCQIIYK